jgi:hypothetical protein
MAGIATVSAGQLDDNDTLQLEQFATSTDLVTMNLMYDLINSGEPGEEAAGRFLTVVASNLALARKYRILLPSNGTNWAATALAYRRLLSGLSSGDIVSSHLKIRMSKVPLFTGIGIYKLDLVALEREVPLVFEAVRAYVDDAGMLGYVIPPSEQLLADSLLDAAHLKNAITAFEGSWSSAVPI